MASTHIPKSNPTVRRTRTAAAPKRRSKKSQLIRLLSARSGAGIAVISDRLGWQPHTTRAALSGLRKAGYMIEAEKPAQGGPARYRITAPPWEAVPPASEVPADAG